MATLTGRDAVSHYLASASDRLANSLLRGAGRAAVTVIADDAKMRCIDPDVAAAIKTSSRAADGVVTAKVLVKGKFAFRAPWLEYGTSAHFISVDDSQRRGRGIRRINDAAKEAGSSHTLVIGGKPVGTTVLHPGARPFPFLRPALDNKRDEAVKAAQGFINANAAKRLAAGSGAD